LVAVNDAGIVVGDDQVITLPADARPQVITGGASCVEADVAKVEGRLNPLGQRTEFYFEYGPDANYGQRTSAQYGGLQITPRTVFAAITGLKPNTEYHYRLVATNDVGAAHGADAPFRTK
jgi:hypothetical protein